MVNNTDKTLVNFLKKQGEHKQSDFVVLTANGKLFSVTAWRRLWESYLFELNFRYGDFSEYEKLAKELSLKDKVFFTGLKKNPFPYLRESDIYILTSLSEGLPNALVEALALSHPIVSANCLSGPAEILHEDFKFAERQREVFCADYGILSPVLSTEKNLTVAYKEDGTVLLEEAEEKFAQAVLMLLRDKELYGKYAEKAEKRVKDFSTDKYLEGLLTLME